MPELSNIFTKGTQAIQVNDKTIYLPVNEDYCFIGVPVNYSESTGKLTVNKLWDTGTTKKAFVVRALYMGMAGTPTEEEVLAAEYVPVYRTGIRNNNFTVDSPQLRDSENTTGYSFLAFFFP